MADPEALARLVAAEHVHLFVIDGGSDTRLDDPGSFPIVVCWIGDRFGGDGPAEADLVVSAAEVDHVVDLVTSKPLASVALTLLLRQTPHLSVELGLAAESGVYSMLQGAPEHAAWRGDTAPVIDQRDQPVVVIERYDDELRVQLNRPDRHNAITRQLRDELCEALTVALVDDTIAAVRLSGAGPSFCSGGELAEFGARPDPAEAHLTRLVRSPARLLHRVSEKVAVHIHGVALGGGLELAAFAGCIEADPDARLGLPEVALGLIPGAGGTVSIPRRIGRQKTAALALGVDTIDATTASAWGLVDEIIRNGSDADTSSIH